MRIFPSCGDGRRPPAAQFAPSYAHPPTLENSERTTAQLGLWYNDPHKPTLWGGRSVGELDANCSGPKRRALRAEHLPSPLKFRPCQTTRLPLSNKLSVPRVSQPQETSEALEKLGNSTQFTPQIEEDGRPNGKGSSSRSPISSRLGLREGAFDSVPEEYLHILPQCSRFPLRYDYTP